MPPSFPGDTETQAAPLPPRRVYRPGTERRQEIIAAAREAFVRSSFAGARTRDIAEAAGVNQATLFKHFPTKEKLFEEAVLQPLIEALRVVQGRVEVYQAAETPEEMGKLAQPATMQHLAAMQETLPLLVTALFSDLERGRRLYRDHIEPLIRKRGAVLEPLVKEGVDPEFVGLAGFGMMFAVAMQQWLGEQPGDLAPVAEQFNRVLTGGFARSGSR
ncbi:TetR family transcriptional regulator [Novosphingobium sp. PhB165]|uniref:TetR/AcrR family transcriptional regulator n=1 Tax=Novosphingobium sp. PhB165 TaxID=2485105 RepID=UPI001042A817|nr:TetR/AcrR family transcriptional regulator [Novosphingobium sp. PhB165]TCM20611.1 TetR family transcriptional regulator [Novosphingobium sp. PhB165]